jgi:hypothetical protein
MKWALVDAGNVVKNLIVYDGVSRYIPPDGLSIIQVNDWVEIGELVDKAEPSPVVSDPEDQKLKRNEALKSNLALIACYEIEKKSNPDLVFSDYIDSLELIIKSNLN